MSDDRAILHGERSLLTILENTLEAHPQFHVAPVIDFLAETTLPSPSSTPEAQIAASAFPLSNSPRGELLLCGRGNAGSHHHACGR